MLWPSYKAAVEAGTEFLFELVKPGLIQQQCKESAVGKKLPDSLYVHKSAEAQLPPLLRLMILAARQIVGDVEYDLIKIALDGKKLSFRATQTLRISHIQRLPTVCGCIFRLPLMGSKTTRIRITRLYFIGKSCSLTRCIHVTLNLLDSQPRKTNWAYYRGRISERETAGRRYSRTAN